MEIFDKIEHFFTSVMPVLTPTIIAWISYRLPKKAKEETDKIVSELEEVKKQIDDAHKTAKDSNAKIDEVQEKLKVHDEAHLNTMRLRLDRDMRRAIRRKYTSRDEYSLVESLHKSYKALGGNGYIDRLFSDFEKLDIRAEILDDDD
jgi:DNA repair ATPase RecN